MKRIFQDLDSWFCGAICGNPFSYGGTIVLDESKVHFYTFVPAILYSFIVVGSATSKTIEFSFSTVYTSPHSPNKAPGSMTPPENGSLSR
jgi:hypothetical protein